MIVAFPVPLWIGTIRRAKENVETFMSVLLQKNLSIILICR